LSRVCIGQVIVSAGGIGRAGAVGHPQLDQMAPRAGRCEIGGEVRSRSKGIVVIEVAIQIPRIFLDRVARAGGAANFFSALIGIDAAETVEAPRFGLRAEHIRSTGIGGGREGWSADDHSQNGIGSSGRHTVVGDAQLDQIVADRPERPGDGRPADIKGAVVVEIPIPSHNVFRSVLLVRVRATERDDLSGDRRVRNGRCHGNRAARDVRECPAQHRNRPSGFEGVLGGVVVVAIPVASRRLTADERACHAVGGIALGNVGGIPIDGRNARSLGLEHDNRSAKGIQWVGRGQQH